MLECTTRTELLIANASLASHTCSLHAEEARQRHNPLQVWEQAQGRGMRARVSGSAERALPMACKQGGGTQNFCHSPHLHRAKTFDS